MPKDGLQKIELIWKERDGRAPFSPAPQSPSPALRLHFPTTVSGARLAVEQGDGPTVSAFASRVRAPARRLDLAPRARRRERRRRPRVHRARTRLTDIGLSGERWLVHNLTGVTVTDLLKGFTKAWGDSVDEDTMQEIMSAEGEFGFGDSDDEEANPYRPPSSWYDLHVYRDGSFWKCRSPSVVDEQGQAVLRRASRW